MDTTTQYPSIEERNEQSIYDLLYQIASCSVDTANTRQKSVLEQIRQNASLILMCNVNSALTSGEYEIINTLCALVGREPEKIITNLTVELIAMSIYRYYQETRINTSIDVNNVSNENYIIKCFLDQLTQITIPAHPIYGEITVASLITTKLITMMCDRNRWKTGVASMLYKENNLNTFYLMPIGRESLENKQLASRRILLFLMQNYEPRMSANILNDLFDPERTLDDWDSGTAPGQMTYVNAVQEAIRGCIFTDDTIASTDLNQIETQISNKQHHHLSDNQQFATKSSETVLHVYSPRSDQHQKLAATSRKLIGFGVGLSCFVGMIGKSLLEFMTHVVRCGCEDGPARPSVGSLSTACFVGVVSALCVTGVIRISFRKSGYVLRNPV
jgi:hypothetical protein